MPPRGIYRGAAAKGFATPTNAPLRVDSTTNTLKLIPVGSGSTEIEQIDASSVQTLTNKTLTAPILTNPKVSGRTPVSVTASTVTLGPTHVGRVTVLNLAAGIAVTLPAATGSGDVYEVVVGTTFTGASSIAVPNATDFFIGNALMGIDGGTFAPHLYPTANTGTVATESDTLSMFGTANSTGGFKGEKVVLMDIAAATWSIQVVSDAGGTEANPFSAAV